MDEKKKYNNMENVLHLINKNIVSLKDENKKKTTPILDRVVREITTEMKKINPTFKSMYTTITYTGSFFDGLKVGKPEEFDCDLVLNLPKSLKLKIKPDPKLPPFVQLYTDGWEELMNSPEYTKYEDLASLMVGSCISSAKIFCWIKSIVKKALNNFGHKLSHEGHDVKITTKESGPAVTINVQCSSLKVCFDVDLVAAIKQSKENWPGPPCRQLETVPECNGKTDFLLIPKQPKTGHCKESYWRYSFPEQEKSFISGRDKLKNALRLMKKLRDTRKHNKIASYTIKTLYLHEIILQDKQFWVNNSLSFVFMHMLKKYQVCLETRQLNHFWNGKYNMLQEIDKETTENIQRYIKATIQDIDKNVETNPLAVARRLLPDNEFEDIQQQYQKLTNKQKL